MTTMTAVKSYQTLDQATGEVKNNIKYLNGLPAQYRFDGKAGGFNRDPRPNGKETIVKGRALIGESMTFQPISYRFFNGSLFGRTDENKVARVEYWAEIFFVDEFNKVSSIMFNNSSVRELEQLLKVLFYDDLSLLDLIITAKSTEKIGTKGTYYIAKFSYELADKEKVEMYKEFCSDFSVYQQDTIKDTSTISVASQNFPLQLFGITKPLGLVQ